MDILLGPTSDSPGYRWQPSLHTDKLIFKAVADIEKALLCQSFHCCFNYGWTGHEKIDEINRSQDIPLIFNYEIWWKLAGPKQIFTGYPVVPLLQFMPVIQIQGMILFFSQTIYCKYQEKVFFNYPKYELLSGRKTFVLSISLCTKY